jgi:hypothetical protein
MTIVRPNKERKHTVYGTNPRRFVAQAVDPNNETEVAASLAREDRRKQTTRDYPSVVAEQLNRKHKKEARMNRRARHPDSSSATEFTEVQGSDGQLSDGNNLGIG